MNADKLFHPVTGVDRIKKVVHLLLFLLIFLLTAFRTGAQQFRPKWVDNLGGANGIASVNGIAVDKENNVYITGVFTDTIDFDPGPGVKYLNSDGNSNGDAFAGKYKADGTLIWAESFPSSGSNLSNSVRPNAIAVDKDGNISISGYFEGGSLMQIPGRAYITLRLTRRPALLFTWTSTVIFCGLLIPGMLP